MIVEVIYYNPSAGVAADTFHCEQRPFHYASTLVSPERSIGAYSTMAGDKDRKWISGQGCADGAGRQRAAEKRRNKAIGTDLSTRYAVLGKQYIPLKIGTSIHANDVQGEMKIFAIQEGLD
ncbi:MAG: hypothetical protein A2Y65_07550 [Deltaproteobacteria bacterium RBG_13_52_11]|nr:MAG: hypothetical protein A2Y65_07550 [Deltaproteobacteria bacterium RBG_13_52_11]